MPAKQKPTTLRPDQSDGKKVKPKKVVETKGIIENAAKVGLAAFEKENPEFSQYLNLQLGMGTVPPTARQEFRKSEIKYRKFLNRYEIWLKQNKPLPKQAPQHVGVIEVGEVYTRVIQGGKEYMRILFHGTGRYEGVETVNDYAKITNPNTGEQEETDQVVGVHRDDLALEYNKEYFEDKIDESNRLLPKNVRPQYYLSVDGIPINASEEIVKKSKTDLLAHYKEYISKSK